MEISIVIPCYRSELTIESVCNDIFRVMDERPSVKYEIIAVNDCSPDGVQNVLDHLAVDHRIKVVELAKNVGKHSALMAGFRYASGDIVICLDDDGQCPVENIWQLIEPLSHGYDVSMANYGTKAQSNFKNFGSKMNEFMMRTMLHKPNLLKFSNFTAMKAFVVKKMLEYDNPFTYVNGLLLQTTNKFANVPMKEKERTVGSSGYTFKKSLALWINGLTAFSFKPLQLAYYIGMGLLACDGIALLICVLLQIFASNPYWPFEILGMLMAAGFGILFLFLGLLGEYVGRIYISINNIPQYVVRKTVNIE